MTGEERHSGHKADTRDKDVSDQLPEEQEEGTAPREGPRPGAGRTDDPERTSSERGGPEDDPGRATGNPGAAG
jgi:hypothetical protein